MAKPSFKSKKNVFSSMKLLQAFSGRRWECRLFLVIVLFLFGIWSSFSWKDVQVQAQPSSVSVNSNSILNNVRPPHSPNCWRRCERRINKIRYTNPRPAGLNDRLYVLESLANLAAYLCATLEFPPPSRSLDKIHNSGKRTDPRFDWTSDFANFTLNSDKDNCSILVSDDEHEHEHEHQDSPSSKKDFNMVHIKTRFPYWIDQQLAQAEAISFSNSTRFVWDIRLAYYRGVRENLLKALPTHEAAPAIDRGEHGGCRYISLQTPNRVQQVVNTITQTLPKNATIGYFHIRRGDMQHECDTSLDLIQKYLDCSLAKLPRSNSVILFSSDEDNLDYRLAVRRMVEKKAMFLDLEAVVPQVLADDWRGDNNYYIYGIINALISKVDFQLAQRRTFDCRKCDPVEDQLTERVGG